MVLRVGLKHSWFRSHVFGGRSVIAILGALALLGAPGAAVHVPGVIGASSAAAQQPQSAARSCARCRATERAVRSIQGELDRQRRARERLYTLISRSDQQIANINEAKDRNAQAVANAARERSGSSDSNRLVELERNLVRLRQETVRLDGRLRATIEQKEARTNQVAFTEAAVRTYREALTNRSRQVQACRAQCLPPLQERVSNDQSILSLDLTRFSVATCPECAAFVLEANRRSAEADAARKAIEPLRNAFERTQRRVTELDGERDQRLLQLVNALRSVTRFDERDRADANTQRLNQTRSALASVLNQLRRAATTRQQAFARLENSALTLRERITAYQSSLEQNPGCVTQCQGVIASRGEPTRASRFPDTRDNAADRRTAVATRPSSQPGRTGQQGGAEQPATSGRRARGDFSSSDADAGQRGQRAARRVPDPGAAIAGKADDRLGGAGAGRTGPRTTVVGSGRDTFAVGRGRQLTLASPNNRSAASARRAPRPAAEPEQEVAVTTRTDTTIDARADTGRPYSGPRRRDAVRGDDFMDAEPFGDGSLKDMPGDIPGPRAVVSVRAGAGQRRVDGASLGTKTAPGGWQTQVAAADRELDLWTTQVELALPGAGGPVTPDLGQSSTTWQVEVKVGEGSDTFADQLGAGVVVGLAVPTGAAQLALTGPGSLTEGSIDTELTKVRAAARLGYYDQACGGGLLSGGGAAVPGDAGFGMVGAMPIGRCQFGAVFGVGYEALDERIRATVTSAAGHQSLVRSADLETLDLTAGLWTRIDLPVHQFADGGLVRFIADGAIYTKTGFADASVGLTVGGVTASADEDDTFFGGGGALDLQLQLQWPEFAVGIGARFEAETTATLAENGQQELRLDTDVASDAQVYLEAKMPF